MAKSRPVQDGTAQKGNRLILTAGIPPGITGTTNLLKIIEVD